jgi:hypothetical protein
MCIYSTDYSSDVHIFKIVAQIMSTSSNFQMRATTSGTFCCLDYNPGSHAQKTRETVVTPWRISTLHCMWRLLTHFINLPCLHRPTYFGKTGRFSQAQGLHPSPHARERGTPSVGHVITPVHTVIMQIDCSYWDRFLLLPSFPCCLYCDSINTIGYRRPVYSYSVREK